LELAQECKSAFLLNLYRAVEEVMEVIYKETTAKQAIIRVNQVVTVSTTVVTVNLKAVMVSIKVAKRDQGRTAFIGEASAEEQLTFFMAECQPGEYVAEIDTPWRRNVNEFTLSIYGPELVQLESMNPQNAGNSFNQDVWIEKSMREKNKLKNFGEKGFPDIFYRVESTGTPFYFFWNQSSSTTVNIKVELVDIFNADPPSLQRPKSSQLHSSAWRLEGGRRQAAWSWRKNASQLFC